MPKHLPTTKPAEAKPDSRARRVSAVPAAQATVEHHPPVIVSPAGQEALTRIVRLLARQTAWEDLSSEVGSG